MGAIALASARVTSASVMGAIAATAGARKGSAATAGSTTVGSTMKVGMMDVTPSKTFRSMGRCNGRPSGRSTLAINFQLVTTTASQQQPADS